jgi:hypothetical protein
MGSISGFPGFIHLLPRPYRHYRRHKDEEDHQICPWADPALPPLVKRRPLNGLRLLDNS